MTFPDQFKRARGVHALPFGAVLKAYLRSLVLCCFQLQVLLAAGAGTATARPTTQVSSACREPIGGSVVVTTQISHLISHIVVTKREDLAISADQSGTLKIWTLDQRPNVGPLLRTINTGGDIWDLAVSSDGRRVATAHDGVICVWDLETGRPVFALRDKDRAMQRVRSIVFANEDRWILSAGEDGVIRVWNAGVGTLERILYKQNGAIEKLSLSASGHLLAAGDKKGWLRLWSLPDGARLWAIRTSSDPVYAIAISEQSGLIASGGGVPYVKKGKDVRIREWSIKDGKLRGELPLTMSRETQESGHISMLSYSLDGKELSIADFDGIATWFTRDRRLERRRDFDKEFAPLVLSDNFIVAEGSETPARVSRDWQTILSQKPGAEAVHRVQLSPDGTRLVSLSTGAICLWDMVTGQRVTCRDLDRDRTHGASGDVCFSPDGDRIILHLEAGEVEALDGRTLSSVWRRPYSRSGIWYYGFEALRVSSDGARIVVVAADKTIRVFNSADGELIRTIDADPRDLLAAWISPDGKFVRQIRRAERTGRSLPREASVSLFDLSIGSEVSRVPLDSKSGIFSAWFVPPSGDILTFELPFSESGLPGDLVLRDGVTGISKRVVERTANGISNVTATPDGRLVAVAEVAPGYPIKVWDLSTAQAPSAVLEGHESSIDSLTFSGDHRHVVSTSWDSIKVWDLPTRSLAASLYTSPRDGWATITPAGFFVSSPKSENLISVVRGFESYPIQHFYETLYRPDLVAEELGGDRESKHAVAAASLSLERILSSGSPPKLELLGSPERLDSAVRIKVRVKDEGGGIGSRVVWRVNGQTRAVSDLPSSGSGTPPVVVEQLLKVVPGIVHTVEVTGYNREGLLASLPLTLAASAEGVAKGETRMHILAIGITEYKRADWRLNLAAGDAEALATTLEQAGKGLFGRIKTTLILDGNATAKGIGAAFARLAADPDVQPNDVFVLYVAAHGRYDGARYFLIPQDLDTEPPPKGPGHTISADAINQDTLQRWIASIQVDKRLVILDTCESAKGGGALIRALADTRIPAMEQLQHATGDNLIAAAGQAAFESNKLGHGLLTYAVLEAFTHDKGASEDEKVTTDTVANRATERVPVLSREIFGQEQWPVRKMSSGVPIPLGYNRLPAQVPEIAPASRRDFVLTAEAKVHKNPEEGALTDPVITLEAPMIVQILSYDDSGRWVRIQWGGGAGVGWVTATAVQEPKQAPRR
ncbi:caspase family protein [Bradyrhizobium diazoefficiens]|uniref:caspase family protein n=1 Tax=Bradyrhizobium diazoefficiens TaxID=1355477 RepID=UPI0004B71087|nr:caspase family protein [Bradyrhizobium diazoefficiens]